jgi:hypothetical protein
MAVAAPRWATAGATLAPGNCSLASLAATAQRGNPPSLSW